MKLYRKTDEGVLYWEIWERNGVHTVHWGKLGERGQTEVLKDSLFQSAAKVVAQHMAARKSAGYLEIPIEEHQKLLVEYAVAGMGTGTDVAKRHRLQDRMDETLGWTGLGHCYGGSIGSGTMDVCCFVVDFETAATVIEADLRDAESADYSRIYREGASNG